MNPFSFSGILRRTILPFFGSSVLLAAVATAAEPAGGDERMRAALRDATGQLRSAQAELAALQATAGADAAARKELEAKYELVRKQSAAERTMAEKAQTGLTAQVEELKAQNARLTAALEKMKAEGERVAGIARTTTEQATKQAGEIADLKQKLASREQRNLALFLVGNEILTRYEEFSLGSALRAKEPFVGSMRTRLENLVQDYRDKLDDQRVKE